MNPNGKKFSIIPYLFIFPALVVYVIFVLVPLLLSFVLSVTNYNLNNIRYIGFYNYERLFRDDIFLHSVVNTLIYSVFVVLVNMAIGLLLAAILNEKWLKVSKLYRTILYIPYIISPIAASMIWLYIYDQRVGFLNVLVKALGFPAQSWLVDERLALPSIILMGIWQGVGYCMVIYLSGLQGIPQYLYEAATIDGASKVRQFFKISIPMLAPTTFFLLVMTMISSFQVFAQIMVMTNGGPLNSTTTIAHQIYINAFQQYQMGYASSMSVVLFLMVLVLTLIFFRYGNKDGGAELD